MRRVGDPRAALFGLELKMPDADVAVEHPELEALIADIHVVVTGHLAKHAGQRDPDSQPDRQDNDEQRHKRNAEPPPP